jgi:Zn-dependent peptidase ImmA (M78 family)
MKWVVDKTGRFAQRPHYDPEELDGECEALISSYLRDRHGKISFPIDTNDLVVLLEREARDVDLFADLSAEGPDVEGVTHFNAEGKPDVKIAGHLSREPWSANRFRTTATHELGHVKFHNGLWPVEPRLALFYPEEPTQRDTSPRCKRDNIQTARATDWMEWQAGYACGAFLMPVSHLKKLVVGSRRSAGLTDTPSADSPGGDGLISAVKSEFDVSADAARVRLYQLRLISQQPTQSTGLPI